MLFWYGMLAMLLLCVLVRGVAGAWSEWRLWYRGLPIWKQLGLLMLNAAMWLLKQGNMGVQTRRFDNRLWFSPESVGFLER